MQLESNIDEFLGTISESSIETYRLKINIFMQFLVIERDINDSSCKSYLESMTVDDVLDSLDYYININHIKSQTIAWHYASVIRRFFNFLYINDVKNNILINSFGLSSNNSESFQNKMKEKIINDNRLEKKDSKEELSWQDVSVLIAECDQRIEEIYQDDDNKFTFDTCTTEYNDFVSSVVLKLILFAGIPYRVVKSIKYGSINYKHNTIQINSFDIHLPNNLCEQLSQYIKIREYMKKGKINYNEPLFVDNNGYKLGRNTSIISDTLYNFIGRRDLAGLIKFAVMQMIEVGLNQSVIQKFNMVGNDIYNYCQDKVNEEKGTSSNRYIDSKLRNLCIFDKL